MAVTWFDYTGNQLSTPVSYVTNTSVGDYTTFVVRKGETKMKMRVKKNFKSLGDSANCGIADEMIKREGTIINVTDEGNKFRGAGYAWSKEWLEPLTKNEIYLEEYKESLK
jgi:hypothetical protein